MAEDIVAEIKAGLKELERVKKNEEAAHDDSDADSDDSISQQKGDMNILSTLFIMHNSIYYIALWATMGS